MALSKVNTNILGWMDDKDLQHQLKEEAYGRAFPMPVKLGFIPPFQLQRAKTGAGISTFHVINVSTGTTTDVTTEMIATGLEVLTDAAWTDFDMITYPAIVKLFSTFTVGAHYLMMEDTNGVKWYSEYFNWVDDDMENFIKLEYWHTRDLPFPGGTLRYTFPFKHYLYIKSRIGKPRYAYEERVSTQGGKNFALEQISYKSYVFVLIAPEFFIDALRFIWHHDCIKAFFLGVEYDIDEIIIGEPDWGEQGDLASVDIEFRTDTVIHTNGQSLTAKTYQVTPGDCFATDYTAVARIQEGSADWNNGTYNSGANNLTAGDLVVVQELSLSTRLYQYISPGTYSLVGTTSKQTVYNTNDDEYWFYDDTDVTLYLRPLIDTVNESPYWVKGRTFKNTLVEVYTKDDLGVVTLAGFGTAAQFESATGISFDPTDDNRVFVRALTIKCPNIIESFENQFDPPAGWITPTGDIWEWLP